MHDTGTLNTDTQKPDIVEFYNLTKGGVDVFDKLHTLLEIVDEFIEVVENKKTDATTCEVKRNAWDTITFKYNALASIGARTSKQLKALYDIMKKKKARQNISSDKVGQKLSCFNFVFILVYESS
jgi:hypothetical protein